MTTHLCGTCAYWDRENTSKDTYGNLMAECLAPFPSCFSRKSARLMYADDGEYCPVYKKLRRNDGN